MTNNELREILRNIFKKDEKGKHSEYHINFNKNTYFLGLNKNKLNKEIGNQWLNNFANAVDVEKITSVWVESVRLMEETEFSIKNSVFVIEVDVRITLNDSVIFTTSFLLDLSRYYYERKTELKDYDMFGFPDTWNCEIVAPWGQRFN